LNRSKIAKLEQAAYKRGWDAGSSKALAEKDKAPINYASSWQTPNTTAAESFRIDHGGTYLHYVTREDVDKQIASLGQQVDEQMRALELMAHGHMSDSLDIVTKADLDRRLEPLERDTHPPRPVVSPASYQADIDDIDQRIARLEQNKTVEAYEAKIGQIHRSLSAMWAQPTAFSPESPEDDQPETPERPLNTTTDARAWAKAFMDQWGDATSIHGPEEDTMFGWFSNAIETAQRLTVSGDRQRLRALDDRLAEATELLNQTRNVSLAGFTGFSHGLNSRIHQFLDRDEEQACPSP
jgi:hypothetical protein